MEEWTVTVPQWSSVWRLIAGAVVAVPLLCMCCVAADAADVETRTPVRGVVRPVEQATISTDLSARVAEVRFKEGDRFARGDLLVAFDCRRHQAELAAADAIAREMQLTLKSNQTLERHQAVGRNDVEISRLRVAKAEAEADALRARLELCRIIAPFDGRVTELTIQPFETPAPGRPFITIIADGQLEIELIVPSDWLSWLRVGSEFIFNVDEVKMDLEGSIIRLAAAVDPVSQTIKVVGRFKVSDVAVIAGMSGTGRFRRPGT
jgi:RND family efflux transporter MFP subunit